MSTKDSMIRARTTKKLKNSVEKILKQLGISPSQAINIFYKKIVLTKGIPFSISLEDNDTTDQYTTIENEDQLKALLKLS